MSDTTNKKQPAPRPGIANVVDQIIKDYQLNEFLPGHKLARVRELLIERRAVGIERYGRPLEVGNGRDPIQDLEEEIVDAFQYVNQATMEGRQISKARAEVLLVMVSEIAMSIKRMEDRSYVRL